jgi:putative spermidine/putrescine transport system permease protein
LAFSLAVTLASLLAGYPIAYFMVRHVPRWSGLIIFLLVAPLLTSIIMRTFGWRVLLARRGFINTLLMDLGIIEAPLNLLNGPVVALIGTVHVLVAFMVLAIASSLQGVDRRLEESAMILGAGRISTFLRITLPLTIEGIGTGFILVFMLANGSFVTLLLLGGGSVQTLPLLIYQQFNTTRDFALAAAMSNVLLATAIACLILQIRLLRRKGVKTR